VPTRHEAVKLVTLELYVPMLYKSESVAAVVLVPSAPAQSQRDPGC
jgi:hypothetical protein